MKKSDLCRIGFIAIVALVLVAFSAQGAPMRWIGPKKDINRQPALESWESAYEFCASQGAQVTAVDPCGVTG